MISSTPQLIRLASLLVLAQTEGLFGRGQLILQMRLLFTQLLVDKSLILRIKLGLVQLLRDLLIFLLEHSDDGHLNLGVDLTVVASRQGALLVELGPRAGRREWADGGFFGANERCRSFRAILQLDGLPLSSVDQRRQVLVLRVIHLLVFIGRLEAWFTVLHSRRSILFALCIVNLAVARILLAVASRAADTVR